MTDTLTKKDEEKLVALYCRVSTTEQAEEGYSIGEQERLLIEYCQRNHYKVYKVFSDKGISGKDIKHRPAMTQLLEEAVEKKFNMVISWKINRLSRKLADAIKIVDVLEKNGITYRSYSEPFETDTPSGKMQFQMMALIGEFERSTIAQNVKMGMCAKARAGEWCGGIAPLGYDWEIMEGYENSAHKKSKLVINEKEAEIVRIMFEEYACGKGYKAIVNSLNKQGYKSKRGNCFSVAQLRSILTNPVYIGKVRYNVRRDWNEKRRGNINPNPIINDGIHEAIIDEELWNAVQYMISQKSGKPSRLYDGEYPLTGILRCPECGAGMVISSTTNTLKDGTKKRIVYYACGAWKNKGTAVCHSNMIRVEKANAVVYSELEKLLNNERIIERVVDKVNEQNSKKVKSAEKEIKKIETDLGLLEKRRTKIFEAYEDSIISSDEFLNRKSELDSEIDTIRSKKEQALVFLAEEHRKEIPSEIINEILSNFGKVLSSDKVERTLKKQLLHMIISKITLDKRREIEDIKIVLSSELVKFIQEQNGGIPTSGVPLFSYYEELGIDNIELEFSI
jgi:site-specific DNA recombinase